MPRFPKKEADIVALAERLWWGLWDNRLVYPQPPVHPIWLRIKSMIYFARRNDFIAAKAAAEQAVTVKNEALEDLTEAMKADIRYAENTVNFDDNKLKLIGWSGRKSRRPLTPPGQPRSLEVPRQGTDWIYLDWKAPTEGGRPKVYKIQRRKRDKGIWQDVATAILTEVTLVEQPRGIELEYRVIAVNKAGDGEPSNTVMVVL